MPIPSSINDLDVNPNNNSPQGSETVGPNANGYLQALSAFIKQISTGTGWKPGAAVDMNGQKVTNIAQGTISGASKDAVRGDQLYKIGEVRMYHGTVANIPTVWGAGWQLADGSNGTADLRDRFVVGAGNTYNPNDKAGSASVTLTTAQLPAHNHAVNDPGHSHSVNDPGHIHGVSDPGHLHDNHVGNTAAAGTGIGAAFSFANPGGNDWSTTGSQTGIGVTASKAFVSVNSAATNVSTQNTGTGAAINILPPYYALCFIEYVGP